MNSAIEYLNRAVARPGILTEGISVIEYNDLQTCIQFQTAVVLNQNLKPIFFNQPSTFSNLLSFFCFISFILFAPPTV